MKYFIFLLIFRVSISMSVAEAAITYYSTHDYKGVADNPLLNNTSLGSVYLENFETQSASLSNVLTTPYATGWNGAAVGSLNGGLPEDHPTSGSIGWRWSDNARLEGWTKAPEGIHFDFSPDTYGRLPEYAGAALLGRVDQFNTGGLYNSIFVYDKDGNEVTGGLWKLPRPLFSKDKLEDHFKDFEGIYVPGGISRIQFRDFSEIDHLTYGYAPLPEPGTVTLAGLAAVGLLLGRRSRG